MANQYISLYTNNPTAGGTDGTAVSLDGSETAPLSVTLDAATNETKTIKCAVRCGSGYKTSGDTTISFEGESAAKWSAADTENGTFSSSLAISDSVGTTNRVFYVKAQSSSDETPRKDTSVKVVLHATIVEAEE